MVPTFTAEKEFASELDSQGKLWFCQPKTFKLSAPYYSYRPDFFVVQDNCFYEIIGTRQAFSAQREKIEAFKMEYPHLILKTIIKGSCALPKKPRVLHIKKYLKSARLPLKRGRKSTPGQIADNPLVLETRIAILKAGLTQKQVSVLSSINYWKLSGFLCGRYMLADEEIQRLQNALEKK